MPLIETEEAARRLARAIASDLSLYNEEKIVAGIQNISTRGLQQPAAAGQVRERQSHRLYLAGL